MPSRGQAITITYVAWDTSANAGKTGDSGNHTLRWVKDGTSGSPTNSPSEVDATNAPGLYKLVLTAAECTCHFGDLAGVSSTSDVSIIPKSVTFEQLPTAAPDAAGGLPISDAGGLDLDSQLANTHEVTAARMGALTDWINGGRLDLILDAIAADVVNLDGSSVPTAGAIADAILEEDPGEHTNPITVGKLLNDVLADTSELQTNQGNWLTATGFALATVCTEARLAELDAANLPADVDGITGYVDSLESRLTAARAGYLDNLAVGGLVASQADIAGITQAQRVRVIVPNQMERPDAGSTTYRLWIYAYDETHQAEDLDGNPTVTAENQAGTDRSANLGTVTKPGATTGQYYVDYTVADSHAVEGLVFKVSATEGGVTTEYPQAAWVVDTTAVDFGTSDRTMLTAVYNDWSDGGRLDLILDARASQATADAIETDTQDLQAQIGTAGAGLTGVPWNAAWDAEVQSEAADALTAYDPPTKTELDAAFTEIKGGTWSAVTDTLEAIRDQGDAAWITADVSGLSTFDPTSDTVDTLTYETLFKVLLSALVNVATPSGNDVVFKARDGSTPVLTITYTATDGERSASVIA